MFTSCIYNAQNSIHLFSSTGIPFILSIDSQVINTTAQIHVKTALLKKDTIRLKINFTNNTQFSPTVFLLVKKKSVKNKEFTYAIEAGKTNYRLRYIGFNAIKDLPKPLVPEKPIEDTSWKINNNLLENYCELKNGKPIYFNNLSTKTAMPDSYVGYAMRLMSRLQQDDDKLIVIEQTILKNYLTSSQLKKLIVPIPFELDKLKTVRLAYEHITDKNNLNSLSDLFSYESSKRELNDFLKSPEVFKAPTITKECEVASEEKAITEFVELLKQAPDDSQRLSQLKKKTTNYCYTTPHLKSILKTFIHDREKLEATKLMYYTCVKKYEVIQVSDSYSYSETGVELKRFLEQFEK